MISEKLLSYSEVVSEIKSETLPEHWDELKDPDDFIRTHYTSLVTKTIPFDKMAYAMNVIPVKNGVAQLPRGIESIVGVFGSNEVKKKTAGGWRKEIVGAMIKATKNCTYTVMKDCDGCEEPDCDSPVFLAAQQFENQLGVGQREFIYRHTYGYGEKDGCATDPYLNEFFVMHPNTNRIFESEAPDVLGCINYKLPHEVSTKFEYEMHNGQIKTTFDSGFILISYRGQSYGADDMIQFPYSEHFLSALRSFCVFKLYTFIWRKYRGDSGYLNLKQDAERQYKEDMAELNIELSQMPYHKIAKMIGQVREGRFNPQNMLQNTGIAYPSWLRYAESKLNR